MVDSVQRRRLLQAALAAGMAPAVVRAQSKIELKISHYVPAVHGLQVDFIGGCCRSSRSGRVRAGR